MFNILYKEYYKGLPKEEVEMHDLGYLNVWRDLSNMPKDIHLPPYLKDLKIYIGERDGNIHVGLYEEEEDEVYAIDLTPWNEIIDMEIHKDIEINNTEALAHILWEITFYGFTNNAVKKRLHEMHKLCKESENLIPWKDLKKTIKELEDDESI